MYTGIITSSGEITVMLNFLSSSFCEIVYPAQPVPTMTMEAFAMVQLCKEVGIQDEGPSNAQPVEYQG